MQEQEATKSQPTGHSSATELDTAAKCPMCGGEGGWPGLTERVTCKPCKGTGKNMLPPPDAWVDLRH